MWLVTRLVAFFVFQNTAACISLPFKIATLPPARSLLGSTEASADPSYGLQNLQDNVYVGDIWIAGQNFTVQFDTGSSDLWIDPSVAGVSSLPGATNTGVQSAICYLDTTCAEGPIMTGSLSFGNFTVPDQAFINAVGSNATFPGMNGLLGLGSTVTSASSIQLDLTGNQNVDGHTVLENVLDTYLTAGNYITFQLSRSETGNADGGIFTIGELANGLEAVQQAPQSPVLLDTRWATAINGMVINGVPMIGPSSTGSSKLAAGQLLANLDTGTARAAAPPDFVDAMYANMPGALFDGVSRYTLPCNDMVTVDIVFGNQTLPIHPIDLVIIADKGENARTDSSNFYCLGAFSYLEPGASDIGDYFDLCMIVHIFSAAADVILGDTFLRNVYTLYNFGNWTRESDPPPFIQLLSTTNESEAEAEYASLNNARLAAKNGLKTNTPSSKSYATRTTPLTQIWTLLSPIILCTFSLML